MAGGIYPKLGVRVRAALIDSVILAAFFFPTVVIIEAAGVTNHALKVILFCFPIIPILVVEPGLVSFTGGSIGHHLLKIRVAKAEGAGNIGLPAAIVRFICKLLLGWTSLLFIPISSRHQALHDRVAGSVVLSKTPAA